MGCQAGGGATAMEEVGGQAPALTVHLFHTRHICPPQVPVHGGEGRWQGIRQAAALRRRAPPPHPDRCGPWPACRSASHAAAVLGTAAPQRVHLTAAGFVLQGGDIVKGDGSAGDSIYGGKFKDEPAALKLKWVWAEGRPLLLCGEQGQHVGGACAQTACAAPPHDRHDAAGIVGFANSGAITNTASPLYPSCCACLQASCLPCTCLMPSAAAGKHSNTSQFYITLAAAPQCDGKHVVIGRVVEGLGVLKQIGALSGARLVWLRDKNAHAWCSCCQSPLCDMHLCRPAPSCRGAGGQQRRHAAHRCGCAALWAAVSLHSAQLESKESREGSRHCELVASSE